MWCAESVSAARVKRALAAALLVTCAGFVAEASAQRPPPGEGARPAPERGMRSPPPHSAPRPAYRPDHHHHHDSSVIFFGPSVGWWYPYDSFYFGYGWGWPYPAYPAYPGYYRYERPPARASEPVEPVRTQPIEVFVYPERGQSAGQQADDRYECHRWGVGQSGFDPVKPLGGVAESEWAGKRDAYQRALSACLAARGYAVR